MEFRQTFTKSNPAPVVPPFALRGPSLSFPRVLKPDLMAPGYLILGATISPNGTPKSYFQLTFGTSVACTHAVGVVALLKVAHTEWSPAAITFAIITTANPLDNTLNPIKEKNGAEIEYSSPLGMEVGQIDPNKALDPSLIYDATPQDYVNQLCHFMDKSEIDILTRSRSYSCLNPSYFISFSKNGVMYPQKFKRMVTNVAKGSAKIQGFGGSAKELAMR